MGAGRRCSGRRHCACGRRWNRTRCGRCRRPGTNSNIFTGACWQEEFKIAVIPQRKRLWREQWPPEHGRSARRRVRAHPLLSLPAASQVATPHGTPGPHLFTQLRASTTRKQRPQHAQGAWKDTSITVKEKPLLLDRAGCIFMQMY